MIDIFRDAGVLGPLDVHFAHAIARLGAGDDALVLLGMAMASRAPNEGHVCAELSTLKDTIRLEGEEGRPPPDLPWPDVAAWCDALRASPAVRAADTEGRTPFVLDADRLYLDRYWRHQQRLVGSVFDRLGLRDDFDPVSVRAGLDRLFDRNDRQKLAAAMAVLRGLTVVSGGPGTGKTTTVVRILALLVEQSLARTGRPPKIALAAPTGKAAARMAESVRRAKQEGLNVEPAVAEAIPHEASTLHRLLGMRPGHPTARHDAANPLAHDVVVVDEASMVDFVMMDRVFDAVAPEARLVLLGDRDQLSSVEAGAVLGDVCPAGGRGFSPGFAARAEAVLGTAPDADVDPDDRPGIWDAVIQLNHTWRFGPDSGIYALSRAINAGDGARAVELLIDEVHPDVRLVAPDEATLQALAVDGYRPCAEAETANVALAALARFRVLCAHRRGHLGVGALNRRVELWLAAEGLVTPTEPWYPGRPVLVTHNDHVLRLFNGDAGVVVAEGEARRACFPGADGPRVFSPARLPPHDTVYATTVHKSQGSEFDHVLVVLPEVLSPIVTRELLYTAVTRARQRVTVAATEAVIREAVSQRVQRASGLRARLWG